MLKPLLPSLAHLDADLYAAFEEKLRVRWTHSSTALEGNTLTEGETFGVLRYGLTISGKPLSDHNEVLGHSRALDLLFSWLNASRPITESDLHQLHLAVQISVEVDYLKPVGAWKKEPNSTLAKLGGKTIINDTYAQPSAVPALMGEWLAGFEQRRRDPHVSALEAYLWSHASFVRVHPYADGNGRMARLLSNLPVIEKGSLPILIPNERRLDYVEALAQWQVTSGAPKLGESLLGDVSALTPFRSLVSKCHATSDEILQEAQELQARRDADGIL